MFIKKAQLVFILLALLGIAYSFSPLDVSAAPASNKVHMLTQPNGHTFQARQWGELVQINGAINYVSGYYIYSILH